MATYEGTRVRHITNKDWMNLIARLRRVNDRSVQLMLKHIEKYDIWELKEHRQEIIDYAFGLATKYGEAAAAIACQMYDELGLLSEVVIPAAEPAATASYTEVAKAVNGTLKTGNKKILAEAVGRVVKMAGVDTTMKNALRDGAQWAWIPVGDTCAFCIALAARGWQNASWKAIKNGHAEHIHANCDCTYAVRFNSDFNVDGYDPDKYAEMYYDTDMSAVDPKDRINAMRRAFYAENKDVINAQKRSAYAKRQELNASRAEEMNVSE